MRRAGPSALLATALLAACTAMQAQVAGDAQGHASAPQALEGRPPAGEASPLQALLDAARDGETLEVAPGIYEGDLVVERAVRLVGRGRPTIRGSGSGSVIRVRAAGAVIEGLVIDGRDGGNLGRDSSGVHVAAPDVTIRDCRIGGSLFGVYLREADGAVVEGTTVLGIPGKDPGEKGSGIHVWNTHRFLLSGNTIRDVRDGFYIQSSSAGRIVGNEVRDVRYGIHYMFSDDNTFEDNLFENGAAGGALMYSKSIVFRRNRFVRNRGFASVGLLFKACDEVIAEDNLVVDNARGIFLEGSYRNQFRRNVVAGSDVALVIYDSCGGNRFEDNAFIGNLAPLDLVGRRTDTVFAGNYWSENEEPDLDGDGRSDRPYRLTSVFDHFRGNLTAADLVSQGPAAAALAAAERAFPILATAPVDDLSPRTEPPRLPDVPTPPRRPRRLDAAGLGASLASLAAGAAVLVSGRRRTGR